MTLSGAIRITATIGSLTLTAGSGCQTMGKTSDGMTIVKPSPAQIESAAKAVVCKSFKPITFSGKNDTSETISQVRGHNAAWQSYGCK